MALLKRRLFIAAFSAFALSSNHLAAQVDEKDKVIRVIQDEVQSFLEKDQPRWEDHWVHEDYTRMVFASAEFYAELSSWDSIRASRLKYFASPEKTTTKIEKSNFKVRINGNTAVVHLTTKFTGGAFDPTTKDEVYILEKVDGKWKFAEIFSFTPSSYEVSNANIEGNLNTQGYHLLTLKRNAEALKVFQLNTELYPEAWNTWDSLAEVYMIMGDNEKAIQYYEKSLALNPKNDNAKKYLTTLKEKGK